MEEELKRFKKFNKSGEVGMIILGVFFEVISLACYKHLELIIVIGGFLLGAAIIIMTLKSGADYNKRMEQIQQNGQMPALLSDFRSGDRGFDGSLIVGQYYLIGKNTDTFFRYDEIKQMYQTIHKTNGFEDGRTVTAVGQDGKTRQLCSLKTRGKSNEELEQFFMFVHSKNPNIVFGYKK